MRGRGGFARRRNLSACLLSCAEGKRATTYIATGHRLKSRHHETETVTLSESNYLIRNRRNKSQCFLCRSTKRPSVKCGSACHRPKFFRSRWSSTSAHIHVTSRSPVSFGCRWPSSYFSYASITMTFSRTSRGSFCPDRLSRMSNSS